MRSVSAPGLRERVRLGCPSKRDDPASEMTQRAASTRDDPARGVLVSLDIKPRFQLSTTTKFRAM
jgi:hypothetical protein